MIPENIKSAAASRATVSTGAWCWIMTMLALASLVSILDRSAISVMVIDIKASLDLTDTQISLAQGLAFAAVYCLGSLYIGGLADRYPRRNILCAGMILWSVAATSTAFVTGFAGLLVVRMLIGLGEATVTPCALSLLSQIRKPEQLAGSISLFVAAGTAGTGTAFALGGWLLDHFRTSPMLAMDPWRQVMIVLGLPGIGVALLILTIREPGRQRAIGATAAPPLRAFLAFAKNGRKAILALLAVQGLTAMMIYSAMGWGVTYGRRVVGLDAAEIGGAMGLVSGAGGIIGAIAMGLLVDRLSMRGVKDASVKCYVVAACISMPLSAYGFLSDEKTSLLIGLVALQCGIGSTFGALMATQQMITPQVMRGRMAALSAITSNIVGFGVGPLTVGLLTDHVYKAPERVGWSVATVLVLAGLCSPLILWRARHAIRILADTARLELESHPKADRPLVATR